VFETAPKTHSAVTALHEIVQREMSSRLLLLRNEQMDRVWEQRTQERLRALSDSGKGISSMATFTMGHAGRSRGFDARNPKKLVMTSPGGPAFTVRDWIEYPESLTKIERLWTDLDFLYFDEKLDFWYYRLTREDIARQHTTLAAFLKPIHDILKEDSNFQFLVKERPPILAELTAVKGMLIDRIKDPKHLSDLIFW
jgi:hypothetical protein